MGFNILKKDIGFIKRNVCQLKSFGGLVDVEMSVIKSKAKYKESILNIPGIVHETL